MNEKSDAIHRAFSGATWLFLTAIIQKCFTFCLTHFLVRSTNPDIFGIAAIQLELLLSTLLFLSREGIRLATLRLNVETYPHSQQLINISWLPSLLILLFLILYLLYMTLLSHAEIVLHPSIIILYSIGAFLESIGEPWFNTFNNLVQITPKIRAETISVTMRTISTFILVGYLNMGVEGFAIAQVIYGATYLLILISHTNLIIRNNNQIKQWKLFSPRYISSPKSSINHSKQPLFTTFNIYLYNQFGEITVLVLYQTFFNSFLKHILTEADKIVLSLFSSSYNQGVYAVANNYSSLIARLCFLPIEEASRLAFSKMIGTVRTKSNPSSSSFSSASATTTTATATSSESNPSNSLRSLDTNNIDNIDNSNDTQKSSSSVKYDVLREMATVLSLLLRILVLFGLLFPAIGPSYARFAVRFILGRRWYSEDMVHTIASFCVYITVLGLNGVSEAFVMAVAPRDSFISLNIGLISSSVTFAMLVSPLMNHFGTSGLVWANVCGMCVRIGTNLWFIHHCFENPKQYLTVDVDVDVDVDISSVDSNAKLSNRYKISSPVLRAVPDVYVLISMATASFIVMFSSYRFASSIMSTRDCLQHLIIGITAFIAVLIVVWWKEKVNIRSLLHLIRGISKEKSN